MNFSDEIQEIYGLVNRKDFTFREKHCALMDLDSKYARELDKLNEICVTTNITSVNSRIIELDKLADYINKCCLEHLLVNNE